MRYQGFLTGLLVAGCIVTKAVAGSDCVTDGTQEATAKIVECASFYLVVASGMKATPGQEQQEKEYAAASTHLLSLGEQLGATVGISVDATVARYKLHI